MHFSTHLPLTILLQVVAVILFLDSATAKPLRLCHTNDFHAKYLEVGESNVKCPWWDNVADNCFSSVARLKTAFTVLKCDVKIQAGDWVQGSMLDTVFQQQIAIDTYHMINYDFAIFGNHEFDFGNEHINDTIHAISPRTTWISSNVFFDGGGMDALPLFRFVDRHGVCWVSTLTKETLELSATEDNVRIENEDEYMRKYIKQCSQQKNVIALTHQGYNNDLETCKNVKEIDLIIGGHSHTNLDNGQYPVKVTREDGSICWVTTAYAHGRYVGVLDAEFDDDGVLSFKTTQYLAMDYRIPRNLEVYGKMQAYDLQVSKKAEEPIGSVTEDVDGGKLCRGPEEIPSDGTEVRGDCGMGDLVCDAVLEAAKSDDSGLERVCVMNGGTMRNSFLEGTVTLRDLVNVLPFGNSIASLKLKGKDILETLKHGLSLTGTDNRGGFPGGLGNMKVTTALDGSKGSGDMVVVSSVTINGKALKEDGDYLLMTNAYMAGGGDGYGFPVDFVDWGTLVRDVVQTYMGKHDPFTPVGDDDARLMMSGSEMDAINDRTDELNEDEDDGAHVYVNDETLGVETELDDSLALPPKETKSMKNRQRKCRKKGGKGKCKA